MCLHAIKPVCTSVHVYTCRHTQIHNTQPHMHTCTHMINDFKCKKMNLHFKNVLQSMADKYVIYVRLEYSWIFGIHVCFGNNLPLILWSRWLYVYETVLSVGVLGQDKWWDKGSRSSIFSRKSSLMWSLYLFCLANWNYGLVYVHKDSVDDIGLLNSLYLTSVIRHSI